MSMFFMEITGYNWPYEYTQDMFDVLRDQEMSLRPKYMHSPQLGMRSELVDWMKTVCIQCNLNFLVLHLSVALLDNFMDNYDIMPFRLRLVATTCILAAAKFEQNGSPTLPTYKQIYSIGSDQKEEGPDFSVIPSVEKKVLEEYCWRLSLPTVATFVSFLLPLAMLPYDVPPSLHAKETVEKELRMEVRDHLQGSLNKILFDQRAMLLPPSMMASACVMVARMELQLEPSWPEHLIKLTQYQAIDLAPALHVVLGYYRDLEMECSDVTCDSGYASPNPTP